MNRLVVYKSETGFTKKYAEWIAAEIGATAMELSSASKKVVTEADLVIYGGSLMAGKIGGYDKVAAMGIKNLVVYSVGFSDDSKEVREKVKSDNHLENIPSFYMKGGICYEKLGFLKRKMIKMITKQPKSVDCTKKENINELVAFVKERY